MYVHLHIKCPLFLPGLMKLDSYGQNWHILHWEPSCSMRTEGWKDRQILRTNSWFINFANAPNKTTFLPQSAFRCYICFCQNTATFVCIHSLAGSNNRMSIDELLPTFRKILVPRTFFYSCLTLKMSAVRSSECLYPFTSQRKPIHGRSRGRKRRYSEIVSGRWNGDECWKK